MDCSRCSLGKNEEVVRGEGQGQKLIIIGTAPGHTESRTGRPFVGESGKVLRAILGIMGVDVSKDILITNLVRCRPPCNRNPYKTELDACKGLLLDELAQVKASTILMLGTTVLKYLTNEKLGIIKKRGEWYNIELGGKRYDALATFHPAFIVRPGGDNYFPDLLLDVQRTLEGKLDTRKPVVTILDSYERVKNYFDLVQSNSILAFNLVTTGQNTILALSLSQNSYSGWAIPWKLISNCRKTRKLILNKFRSNSIKWISHNSKLVNGFLLQHFGFCPPIFADTQLMHLALDERRNTHELNVLIRDYLGVNNYWEGVKSLGALSEYTICKFAGYDSSFIFQLYQQLKKEMDEDNVTSLHDNLLVPASETFMHLENDGIFLDMDEIDEWQYRLEEELDEDQESLQQEVVSLVTNAVNKKLTSTNVSKTIFWTLPTKKLRIKWSKTRNRYIVSDKDTIAQMKKKFGRFHQTILECLCWRAKLIDLEFSANSWQKVGVLVYCVLELERLGQRGEESSTASELLTPYQNEHPVVAYILSYRTKRKLKSTYVDSLVPDKEFRVHPTWNLCAAVTGRLGCNNPNMMNIPHEAGPRGFFLASPNSVMIQADYSQAELRVLAHCVAQHMINVLVINEGEFYEFAEAQALDSFLVKCYRKGRDLHTEVAVALFGENWGYEERTIAKEFNFGLVYGRSAKGLADALDIPLKEAEKYKKTFFDRMPEVKRYLEHLEQSVFDPGEVQNVFGRKRRFHYLDDRNIAELQRQARNYNIQSTASDLTLLATIRISEWLREIGYGSVLVFLHDSILIEVPESMMNIAAKRLYDIMLEVPKEILGDIVPFKVDTEVGYSWASLYGFDPEKGVLK